jgi:methylmalonyl-CoA mutase cobalamin-binding domain/chain
MTGDLGSAIVALRHTDVIEAIRRRIEAGEEALVLLEECRRGMAGVGERFQCGEYYLSELLLSAEIFKEAMAVLDPHLVRHGSQRVVGKVVLATMRGDIHDLGKNILATLLRAHRFEVHDLGVDVSPARLVEVVEEVQPDFVGFSALMTTAFTSMKEAAEMLGAAGRRDGVKLMVGGGVTSPAVRDYVGADFQTVDAMQGVAYCLEVAGERRSSCPNP